MDCTQIKVGIKAKMKSETLENEIEPNANDGNVAEPRTSEVKRSKISSVSDEGDRRNSSKNDFSEKGLYEKVKDEKEDTFCFAVGKTQQNNLGEDKFRRGEKTYNDNDAENNEDLFSVDNDQKLKECGPFHVDEIESKLSAEPRISLDEKVGLIKYNKRLVNEVYVRLDGVRVKRVPTSSITSEEFTILADNSLRCNHCQYVGKDRKTVNKHIRIRHREETKLYFCPLCDYNTKDNKTIKFHIMRHEKEDIERAGIVQKEFIMLSSKEYKCNHCQDIKTDLSTLTKHILAEHRKIEWFRCDKCDFKSQRKTYLENHVISRHMNPVLVKDQMKKCLECPKMYVNNFRLQRHILMVHKKQKLKKSKCPEPNCEYLYGAINQLRLHREACHSTIVKSETLECSKCNFTTISFVELRKHERNHKRLQCEQCGYQTHLAYRMKLHLINHKDIKNEKDLKYRCDKCDYKTYRDYNLTVHKLKHMKPEEIQYFYCYHCNFKAKRKDNLKTHVLKHLERNKFPCFVCDFTAKSRDVFQRHIDEHSRSQEEPTARQEFIKIKQKAKKKQ